MRGWQRFWIAACLLSCFGCGKGSTPYWIEQLKASESITRIQAIHTPQERKSDAETVIPALSEALKDENIYVRRDAARALGVVIHTTPGVEPGQITLTVPGGAAPHGAMLDGEPIIDSVPVLAALACFAEGTTTFHHVANLRLKESNRIDALCAVSYTPLTLPTIYPL